MVFGGFPSELHDSLCLRWAAAARQCFNVDFSQINYQLKISRKLNAGFFLN